VLATSSEEHVVVSEGDDVAAGQRERGVDRKRLARFRHVKVANLGSRRARRRQLDDGSSRVGGAVVGDDDFVPVSRPP
jgi:hypothetical protein